ncbi:MAG: alkaline shock response membrane anchor protein AmaP [Finegoldia sp.]|nr:alkaline shock response membrane anchor protein AmaP [Finegoldia sp.]
MKTLKRILWIIMIIVLILVGGLLAAIGFAPSDVRYNILSFLEDPNYVMATGVFGIILLVFALILLIDLLVHRNEKSEYLVESDSGDVKISKNSLTSCVRSSVSKFPDAELTSVDVIVNSKKESVDANLVCNVYNGASLQDIGTMMKKEVERGLIGLTGIRNVNATIKLNNQSNTEKRELR